jgi:hypothetical protein
MTLSTIKIFLKKSWAWCIQHWRWLVFGIVALIAYLAGRKNARGLWRQAELARKHYKAEAAAIEKAHAEKDKKIKLAVHEADKAIAESEKEKTVSIDRLEKEKQEALKQLLRDQSKIDQALKDSGINEV